jgi:hypothetical protein
MSSNSSSDEYIFVAEGGFPYGHTNSPDPYQDLDELMVVVEALCVTWPQRALFQGTDAYLL